MHRLIWGFAGHTVIPHCWKSHVAAHLCNFGRCIMINNSVKLFWIGPLAHEEILFKRFLIWSSGSPHVQWSRNIYAILVRALWGTFIWSYLKFWTSGSGGDLMLFKEKVYWNKRQGGRRGITIAHLEPSAQVELKIINAFVKAYTCKILTQFFSVAPLCNWLVIK